VHCACGRRTTRVAALLWHPGTLSPRPYTRLRHRRDALPLTTARRSSLALCGRSSGCGQTESYHALDSPGGRVRPSPPMLFPPQQRPAARCGTSRTHRLCTRHVGHPTHPPVNPLSKGVGGRGRIRIPRRGRGGNGRMVAAPPRSWANVHCTHPPPPSTATRTAHGRQRTTPQVRTLTIGGGRWVQRASQAGRHQGGQGEQQPRVNELTQSLHARRGHRHTR
jgi:hypothetical protein